MPLYMDFHKIAGVTIEDVKKAHMADRSVQEKYGVKYHQFWVNQEAGTIFCLTEGPDMKTCELVHRLAHGNIACAMTEVEPGYYRALMGEGHQVDHGIVRNEDGSMDLGYRSILAMTVEPLPTENNSHDRHAPLMSGVQKHMVLQKINEYKGRHIKSAMDDSVVGVFNDAAGALRCARHVRDGLSGHSPQVMFKAGLSAGQPVTEDGEFFTKVLQFAHRLNSIAAQNQILVCSLATHLCNDDLQISEDPSVRTLIASEEDFLSKLLLVVEKNLSNETFTIQHLSHELGVSRPQLYRKVTALTGRSPNDLLRDLRMDKALTLLKRKTGNISEIALDVGFSNPSYFARTFARKFGCTPSMLQRRPL